ncbi:MAG: hypothetical protein GTN76_07140 [Candidatus Aenigmarchaeota archaeon]|nr:hypothetical protein [Candidatus Aenigmarchaeota archaeon]
MDLKTLRRTVEELIESLAPIAQNHPDIRLDNKDFARLLEVAKGLFFHNEVIKNMNAGEWKNEISAAALLQKLSIIKAEIEETRKAVS